jgi:tetratricopeptide (TPR) repeat protein
MRAHLIFGITVMSLAAASLTAASAAVTILGGGLPEACSKAARSASNGSTVDTNTIVICTLAIDSALLSTHDRAGTYVNRGILYLSKGDFRSARKDFDTALYLVPSVGEAYVNRGAALIGEHRFAEGLADIDQGLALSPEQPEKAYFNRGLAHEYLDDLKAAYLDYMKALELKPDWEEPKKQLARFVVSRRPKTGGS